MKHGVGDERAILHIILAGGRGERLRPFTDHCPKPLLPLFGGFRVLDFTLANCLRSAGGDCIVLVQHLADQFGPYLDRCWTSAFAAKGRRLTVMGPPGGGEDTFEGTAHALLGALGALDKLPEAVVVLAGDHVYRMDYDGLVAAHRRVNRLATIGVVPCRRKDAPRFGILCVDGEERVQDYREKPQSLAGLVPSGEDPLASMGIYAFSGPGLLHWMNESSEGYRDLGRDLMPDLTTRGELNVFRHVDQDGRARYWRDVGEPSAFLEVNQDLAGIGMC